MKSISDKRKQVLAFIITLFILATCLGVLSMSVHNFNSRERVFSYTNDTSDEEKDSNDCAVEIAPRGGATDTWLKNVLKDGTAAQYSGIIYEVTIANKTGYEVKDWTLSISAPEDCYINNAWCGTVEIHQNTSADEKVDTLDLRNWKNDSDISLETFTSGVDFMIPMYQGDYFIYHPSTEVFEDVITPSAVDLDLYQQRSVDFIVYNISKGSEIKPLEFTDIEFRYYLNISLLDMTAFWVIVVLFILWLVAFIVIIGLDVKLRKLVMRSQHDQVIIEQSMTAFMGFIDAKDPSTNGHSIRVARYSMEIAKRLGFSDDEANRVYYIGLMHDCGKIGIPDAILKKPARLTNEEFEIIKTHTTQGAKILSEFNSIPGIKEGALYHHERYDGGGYPEGLKGEDIPLIARIICVADSFDTMNSKRYYKERYGRDNIISEMVNNRGTQFDPKIVDVFMGLIDDGTIKI